MSNKYPFFKYVVGDSDVHLMNSKLKIAWVLLMILSILMLKDYTSALIILLFLLFVIYKTKISFDAYVSNVFIVFPIYVIAFIVSFFLTFDIFFSFLMTLKFIFVILILLLLTFTTSLSEIAWGFECLFEKLKKIGVPVSKIALKIAMDIKFISTLFEEFKIIRKSMAYRGVPYNKGSITSFRKMVVPVVYLSYKLSRRMVKAMKLRFYGNSKRRTNYHENKVTNFDKALICFSFVLIYITLWLGWL